MKKNCLFPVKKIVTTHLAMRKPRHLFILLTSLSLCLTQINNRNWKLKPQEVTNLGRKEESCSSEKLQKRLPRVPNAFPTSELTKDKKDNYPRRNSLLSEFERDLTLNSQKNGSKCHLLPAFGYAVMPNSFGEKKTSESLGLDSLFTTICYESVKPISENTEVEKKVSPGSLPLVQEFARGMQHPTPNLEQCFCSSKLSPSSSSNFGLSMEDGNIFKLINPWVNLSQPFDYFNYLSSKYKPIETLNSKFTNERVILRDSNRRMERDAKEEDTWNQGQSNPNENLELNLSYDVNLPLLNALLNQSISKIIENGSNSRYCVNKQMMNGNNFRMNFGNSVIDMTRPQPFQNYPSTNLAFLLKAISHPLGDVPIQGEYLYYPYNLEDVILDQDLDNLNWKSSQWKYPMLPLPFNLTIVNRIIKNNDKDISEMTRWYKLKENGQRKLKEKFEQMHKLLMTPPQDISLQGDMEKYNDKGILGLPLISKQQSDIGKEGNIINFALISGIKGVPDGLYFEEDLKKISRNFTAHVPFSNEPVPIEKRRKVTSIRRDKMFRMFSTKKSMVEMKEEEDEEEEDEKSETGSIDDNNESELHSMTISAQRKKNDMVTSKTVGGVISSNTKKV